MMKNKTVQCVPNFSEGKDKVIIEKIVEPLKNQEGFKLISYESDQNYNRTVVTLIGDPYKMLTPLLAFFKNAVEFIDMNQQKGEHPRMGAIDVVPFIPIGHIDIDECVEISKTFGKLVNDTLAIPVFLYAKSATTQDRVELPSIRKGEFEGMQEKLQDPIWKPDFGDQIVHKTFGVVAIGARLPLIAYNIDIQTTDMKVTKKLAKTIRQSSGGFQYIQAGPALLEDKGFAQVTMNILDYKKNPIYRVYETIHMEALRYGLKIISSEIVGLVPKDALYRSLQYYLDMEDIAYDKEMSIDDVTTYAIKYLALRDFDKYKIIEAHIED